MEIKNHIDALALALKTEEEGFNVFSEFSNKTNNSFLKDLFSQLALDEKKHAILIKKYYDQIASKSSWSKVESEEIKDMSSKSKLDTIFSKCLNEIDSGKFTMSDDDMEVCKWALKFESNGASLYNDLFNKSKDENAKMFYSLLRDMENEHYDTLNNLFLYLESPEQFHKTNDGWTMED